MARAALDEAIARATAQARSVGDAIAHYRKILRPHGVELQLQADGSLVVARGSESHRTFDLDEALATGLRLAGVA